MTTEHCIVCDKQLEDWETVLFKHTCGECKEKAKKLWTEKTE